MQLKHYICSMIIYTFSVNGQIQKDSFTSLTCVCRACGITVPAARKKDKWGNVKRAFIRDEKVIVINEHVLNKIPNTKKKSK